MSMSEKLKTHAPEENQRRELIQPERDAFLYLQLAKASEKTFFDRQCGMFSVKLDSTLITSFRIAYSINAYDLTRENPSMSIPGFETGQLRIERKFGERMEFLLLFSPELKLALEALKALFKHDADPDNQNSPVYNFPTLENNLGILPTRKVLVKGRNAYETHIHQDDPNAVRFKRSLNGADDIATYPTLHDLVQEVMENARKELEKFSRDSEPLKNIIDYEEPFRMKDSSELRMLPKWLQDYILKIETRRYNLGQNNLGKAHRAAERRERIKNVEYAILIALVPAFAALMVSEQNNVAYADLVVFLVIASHLIETRNVPSSLELAKQIEIELADIRKIIE